MIETSTMVDITEKIDEENNIYYCKVSFYNDCVDLKVINKRLFSSIFYKSRKYKNNYVVVAGNGFLRNYVSSWDTSFQQYIKKYDVEFVYLSSIINLNPIFKSFNENSLFMIPKKELKRLEKIWEM